MKNIKITLQYDGTAYSGWQIQRIGHTVQGLLEKAVYAVTGEESRVTGAGRTDAGVHALHQVAVFKTGSRLEPDVFLRALNANLPLDIRIIGCTEAGPGFHPRYDAKSKVYSYFLSHSVENSVFLRRYSWYLPCKINYDSIKEAAGYLTGKHDFSSFRASGCSSKHPERTIYSIDILELTSFEFIGMKFYTPLTRISVNGNAFLRHMVRNIIGTLVKAGNEKIPPERVKDILTARDRSAAGQTAPACGLFLEEIEY
jgi:tRNA pseudouridine38-40 synthase